MSCDIVYLLSELDKINNLNAIFIFVWLTIIFISILILNSTRAWVGILGIIMSFILLFKGFSYTYEKKINLINNYSNQCNVSNCDVLKRLSIVDKSWLDEYYNECILKEGLNGN